MPRIFAQDLSHLVIFFFLLLVIAFAPVAASDEIVRVQTGSSIQAAIAEASPGATIEIAAGEWHENLTIDRSITIHGQGPGLTTIVGKNSGYPVLRVAATQTVSVIIAGMTIAGAHGECADANNKTCADGVLAQGSASLAVSDCDISGNAQYGVHATDNAQITIRQTTISGNYAGIWLSSSALGGITGIALTENGFGVVVFEHAQAQIADSTISASDRDGILIADSASLTITGTSILRSKRTGISIDIPPCYDTPRTFTGLIVAADDTIPDSSDDHGNAVAICPPGLGIIGTTDGGFYPSRATPALLSQLPVMPPMEGDPDAPVTILEFTDFACPFCNAFTSDTLPQIERDYVDTGKVKLYFLPFPVHGIASSRAAEAGFCAQAQGCFWLFQRLLFAQYRIREALALTPAGLTAIAAAAGADRNEFLQCLTTGRYRKVVEATVSLGHGLGVDGTPTFFVNGQRIPGAAPYDAFAKLIDEELSGN